MEVLNNEIRFLFTKDYITQNRNYKKDTICNILNGVVVLGNHMDFLFDVDSNLSRKYGKIINN
jgi:hypothetical protein